MADMTTWQAPGVRLLRTAASAEGGSAPALSENTNSDFTCFLPSGAT